jgi:hypothetical protein
MPEPARRPINRSLRGFWLLCGSVGLAVMVMGATIARAELQLRWVGSRIDAATAEATHPRADEAMDTWVPAWVDTWLREQGQPSRAADALLPCAQGYLEALDEVSVTANVVRFGPIEQARTQATRCAAPALGQQAAPAFVVQLNLRWGAYLERRGDTAPRLTDGERE